MDKPKKHIYYIEAIVEVAVVVQVKAVDEQEAFGRLMDGAWHNVDPKQWDKAKVKMMGGMTKGPGING